MCIIVIQTRNSYFVPKNCVCYC